MQLNNNYAQEIKFYRTNGPFGFQCSSFLNDSKNNLYATDYYTLYKSTDQGNTWNKILKPDSASCDLKIDKNDILYLGSNSGTFISLDFGASWKLGKDYVDSNLSDSKGGQYKLGGNGILYLNNMGEVWKDITPLNCRYEIKSLLIDNMDNIYIAGGNEGMVWNGGVFISTDAGNSWTEYFHGNECKLLHVNKMNEVFVDVCHTSIDSIYCTSNHGLNWTKILPGSYYDVLVNSDDRGTYLYTLFNSAYSQVYFKDYNSSTYTKILDTPRQAIAKYFHNGLILMSYLNGYGISKSSDYGKTWSTIWKDFSSAKVTSITKQGGLLFSTSRYGGVFKSTNNGNDWEYIGLIDYPLNCSAADQNGCLHIGGSGVVFRSTDLQNFEKQTQPGAMSITVLDTANVFYSNGFGDIYRSTDSGQNWSLSHLGGGVEFDRCVIDKQGRIYAANRENIIYSDDKGNTWSNTSFNIWRPLCIGVNSKNEIYVGTFDGLYKSSDRGISWEKIYDSSTLIADRIFIDSKDNIYFIANDFKAYYTMDLGKTWAQLRVGLNDLYVACIEEDADGHLLVGTDQGGVFRSKESIITSVENKKEVPNSIFLYQNYPNPFNPSTTISYSIPQKSFVELKVYDLLGREILILVNGEKLAGKYEVQFDGKELSSGIYFYKLQSGSFFQTKKFVLLK